MTDQPLVLRLSEDGPPDVLNPDVLGGRGVLILPSEVQYADARTIAAAFAGDDRPMAETLADAEQDPLRAWMLSYPGHAEVEPPEPGAGPGWGDQDDLDNGLCCPWCRGSLTAHNRAVHAAGAAMGERHALDSVQRTATEPVREPLSRIGVQDGSAAYDPWAPETTPPAEDYAPRIYMGEHGAVRLDVSAIPPEGVLVLPGDAPDEGPITASDLGPLHFPEPDPLCGVAAYGVRFASCDLPAGHRSQHHAWYDAGHGPTTVLWDL